MKEFWNTNFPIYCDWVNIAIIDWKFETGDGIAMNFRYPNYGVVRIIHSLRVADNFGPITDIESPITTPNQ